MEHVLYLSIDSFGAEGDVAAGATSSAAANSNAGGNGYTNGKNGTGSNGRNRSDAQLIRALVRRLQAVTGDYELECRPAGGGSIDLIVKASARSLDKLQALHRTNELSTRLEREVIALLPAHGNGAGSPYGYDGDPDEVLRRSGFLSLKQATKEFQRRFLQDALESNRWNKSATARQLGIARSHLYSLIKGHDLRRGG